MKVIIAGAGIIGANLAASLTAENHEVYVIENNEEIARKSDDKLDVKVVLGNAADPVTLRKAAVEHADLVIAVTPLDETNLVVCALAAAFGAKRRIARVRNTALSHELATIGYEWFHIDEIINPEEVAAQSIAKTIDSPGAREVADFAQGRILLRSFEVEENSPLTRLTIGEFREEDFPWPFLIVAIIREGKVTIPKGDARVKTDDRIYVLLPTPSLPEFLTFVNPDIRMPRKVVIYGATDIGERVAAALANHIQQIMLLEEDESLAEAAAGRLSRVRIIHGSACETDILKEAGIEAADAFIAATGNDHANLVSAVLARKMGAKSTTIITQQPDYIPLIDALDIDAIVNPRLLAARQILRLVRGKGILAMTKLLDCDAEALEFVAEEDAPITHAPLREIQFPRNSIVGAITKGTEVILPRGDTKILPGERVIVFCQQPAVKKLQRLFTRKHLFSNGNA